MLTAVINLAEIIFIGDIRMEQTIEKILVFFDKRLTQFDSLFEKFASNIFQKKTLPFGISIFLLFMILAVMYLFNLHTTLIVDDYNYSFNLAGKRYTSIQEAFPFLYHHYFSWGGRVIVHFFAIFFLWAGKPIFNICNAFAFLGLIALMYYHAVGLWPWSRKQNYPMILLGILFALFAFTPAFGQDFLWLVGSCNYLWGMLLFLIALVPFRAQLFSHENQFQNPIWIPIFFIGSIAAGWANENMGVTLVFMMALCIFSYAREYHTVHSWMILSLIGAIIGAAFLVLAPGNFVRLTRVCTGGILGLPILHNFWNITKILLKPNFLLIPLCLTWILQILTAKNTDKRKPVLLCLFFFGMLASAYSMIASPFFVERARLGPLVLITICCAALYPYLKITRIEAQKALCILSLFVLVFLAQSIKAGYRDILNYEKRNTAKVEYTLQEKAKGNPDIILPRNYPSTKYCAAWKLSDLNPNPKHWTNTGYARYFGVKQVRVK